MHHAHGRHPRGFSAFELMLVVLVFALVIYALLPRAADGLKLAHETVLRQSASAFSDSLRHVQLLRTARQLEGEQFDVQGLGDGTLDLNSAGFPVGTRRVRGDLLLRAQDCVDLWRALLGPAAPTVSLLPGADFQVRLGNASSSGASCIYSYQRGGALQLRYYPADGRVTSTVRF